MGAEIAPRRGPKTRSPPGGALGRPRVDFGTILGAIWGRFWSHFAMIFGGFMVRFLEYVSFGVSVFLYRMLGEVSYIM